MILYAVELNIITGSCIFNDHLSYELAKKWLLLEFAIRPFCQSQLKNLLKFGSRIITLTKSCSQI